MLGVSIDIEVSVIIGLVKYNLKRSNESNPFNNSYYKIKIKTLKMLSLIKQRTNSFCKLILQGNFL